MNERNHAALDDAMKAAHERGDPDAACRLNVAAAGVSWGDRRRFHLTQAWVFALEAGRDDASAIEERVREAGGFDVSRSAPTKR